MNNKNLRAQHIPPATRCTLCCMKKYIIGTNSPKKHPARVFRYLVAVGFFGVRAKHPNVHGSVATMYEIMKMSCQSWSSVDVTYVHPPHVKVRRKPMTATNFGSVEFGLRVNTYHSPTNANRGPMYISEFFLKTSSDCHTRCECNKEHEDGPLGIAVSNGR